MSPAALAVAQARDTVNNASTLPARMELLRDAIQSLLCDAALLRRGRATRDTNTSKTYSLQVVQTIAVPGAFIVAGEDVDSFLRHLRTDAFVAASPAVVGMLEAELAAVRSRLLDAQNKLWTWQPDARETAGNAAPADPPASSKPRRKRLSDAEVSAGIVMIARGDSLVKVAAALKVRRTSLRENGRLNDAIELRKADRERLIEQARRDED